MTTNGFQLAIEHATAEINEIDIQLQKLTRRKFQTEKILDCLKELVAESGPVAVATTTASESTEHPAPAEIVPTPVSTELETILQQAAELQAPAQESAAIETPAHDAIAQQAHEPAVEHQGEPAPATEFQNMNDYSFVATKSAAAGPPPSVLISAVPRIRIGF